MNPNIIRNIIFLISVLSVTTTAGCQSIATSPEFSGHVIFGPERMSFSPCKNSNDGKPNFEMKSNYWLGDKSWEADGWTDVMNAIEAQPECSLATVPCTPQIVPISGFGILETEEEKAESTGPFGIGFGHMGQYPAQIQFTQISLEDENICNK